jgi:anti-sigma factor RsiW
MSPENVSRDEREEIELLLPWYAAGTLEPDETARVDAYIKAHPDVADHLVVVREEMDETIGVNEALGAPSAGAIDRLMEQVMQESPGAVQGAGGGLVQSLLNWFGDMSPRAVALGATLAIAVICAQAITLGVVMNSGAKFQSATGNGETKARAGTLAIVGFAEGATMEQVGAFLTAFGASIVDGPRGGLYTVRVAKEVLADAERDALLDRVRADPLVRFAGPAS